MKSDWIVIGKKQTRFIKNIIGLMK